MKLRYAPSLDGAPGAAVTLSTAGKAARDAKMSDRAIGYGHLIHSGEIVDVDGNEGARLLVAGHAEVADETDAGDLERAAAHITKLAEEHVADFRRTKLAGCAAALETIRAALAKRALHTSTNGA